MKFNLLILIDFIQEKRNNMKCAQKYRGKLILNKKNKFVIINLQSHFAVLQHGSFTIIDFVIGAMPVIIHNFEECIK